MIFNPAALLCTFTGSLGYYLIPMMAVLLYDNIIMQPDGITAAILLFIASFSWPGRVSLGSLLCLLPAPWLIQTRSRMQTDMGQPSIPSNLLSSTRLFAPLKAGLREAVLQLLVVRRIANPAKAFHVVF
jgi:hypothetical protein